jgi:hypothetical protein
MAVCRHVSARCLSFIFYLTIFWVFLNIRTYFKEHSPQGKKLTFMMASRTMVETDI